MKIEVVASKKQPEKLKVSGALKIAAVAGLMGLGGLAFGNGAVSAMSFGDSMVLNPVYQKYAQDLAAGNGANWKLIPNKYIYVGETGGKGSDGTLPASYDLTANGYGTTLKNQGTDGDCWAFATTTAIESNLKKTQGISVEFSPKQLDYLLASGTPYYSYLSAFGVERGLGDGGNFLIASFPIGGKSAPVLESEFFQKLQANDSELADYSSWREFQDINLMNYSLLGDGEEYTKAMSSSQVMNTASDYTVMKYRHYEGDTDLISTIKENVYKYGAAYVGTTAPEIEGCWDENTKTIIDLGSVTCAGGGHAMAVIGWDDNHTYTDPSDGSTKTGAFLLQNSWGKTSIWGDYGIDTNRIMELLDTSTKTEDEIARMRQEVEDFLSTYDANEKVWLGYDFDDSMTTGWVDFASIQETRAYQYDHVYDSINQAEGFGAEGENTESVYTFTTGDNVEYIDSIAVGTHAAAYNADVEYAIYVDASGTGNKYEKVGSVIMPEGEMGQETVDLISPVEVSGVFKVKVEGIAFGEVQSFDDEDLEFRTVSVYTVDDAIEVPNTAAPNTGWFTGENGGFVKVGGVLVVMGMIAAGLFGAKAYKNRKHLFHKVGFSKKGF